MCVCVYINCFYYIYIYIYVYKFTIGASGGLDALFQLSALCAREKRGIYRTGAAWALAGTAQPVPLGRRALEGAARACF